MNIHNKPRRASARACLKAINKYTNNNDDDDNNKDSSVSEEIESDESDFTANCSTNDSELSDLSVDEECVDDLKEESLTTATQSSSDESNLSIDLKRDKRVLDVEKSLAMFTSDAKQYTKAKSSLIGFFRVSRKHNIYHPVSTTVRKFEEAIERLKNLMHDVIHPFLLCPMQVFP